MIRPPNSGSSEYELEPYRNCAMREELIFNLRCYIDDTAASASEQTGFESP